MALASTAALACLSSCHHKAHDQRQEAPAVDVAEAVEDSVVIYNDYPGTLTAVRTVDIVGRVNGYLRAQNYTDGATVGNGALLFTIEDTQYRDAVGQAEAQLQTARSTYDYARRQYEAMKKALESDAVSQIEVVQAKSAYEEAAAAIKSAEAQLQTARTSLGYCYVHAPFAGTVTAALVNVGAYVGGEGEPVKLATIYDNSRLYADFYIEDTSFMQMNTRERGGGIADSDSIPLHFGETLAHSYAGKLDYLSPDINTGTGTMHLRAVVDNPYGELRSGMYATIALPSDVDPRALLVKDASISTDQLGKYLYTVNDSNRVVYTPIKTGGLVNDTMRVVTGGLKPGARYITKALLKVRAGVEVKPVMTR